MTLAGRKVRLCRKAKAKEKAVGPAGVQTGQNAVVGIRRLRICYCCCCCYGGGYRIPANDNISGDDNGLDHSAVPIYGHDESRAVVLCSLQEELLSMAFSRFDGHCGCVSLLKGCCFRCKTDMEISLDRLSLDIGKSTYVHTNMQLVHYQLL